MINNLRSFVPEVKGNGKLSGYWQRRNSEKVSKLLEATWYIIFYWCWEISRKPWEEKGVFRCQNPFPHDCWGKRISE